MHTCSPRILIVEDDAGLLEQLAELLGGCGFAVVSATRGEAGLSRALAEAYALILLDVNLPDTDGFDVLRRLRLQRQTPVIMLTASGAEEERIRGLRHGADDYLAKPFNLTELQLRIEAVLRRSRPEERVHGLRPAMLDVDGLKLERPAQRVSVDGVPVQLTPIQFRLLWHLAAHRGEALTKPYLYRAVLERDYSRYDRSLDMHVSRIRRRLAEAGMVTDRLHTVHGRGYVLA